MVSTKFTTSTNNTWKQCSTSGWNSGHRKSPAWNLGDFDLLTREEMGWTMLKHQNYGSKIGSGMSFPCFTKLRLIDSELRMIFLDYSPSSSIVYGFRPLSPPNWGSHINGCVLSGYQSSTSNKRFERTQTIKHNQSNLKTLRPLFGVQKYWSRTSKLANEGLSENHLPYTSSHPPVKHKFPYHLMAGVLPTCRHTQI